ncbi:DUF1214 domain-containing protein [Rhodococcus qingshengii]|uniref:DUF1214 domain-containing protein n=1 Tax=Rhodococcus qingshengii TaxID=334542 RepID=UPI001BE575B7|nr:DUF1214 domain-containing protein [Rhodococcus qingshengii]MBT2274334.1 DUF1214 domain-containing protein [Rhodococcus qingshengii]
MGESREALDRRTATWPSTGQPDHPPATAQGQARPSVPQTLRWPIGDRTPGLVYADDGSLTITFSATVPADSIARANWLSTRSAGFRPLLRMYCLRLEVLDGSYAMPAIVKAD